MRNEFSNKRVSALSVLQREIVSTRCKAIDLDFPFYCERCAQIYLIIEETAAPVEGKKSRVTKRVAGLCKAKALVVRFFEDSTDFEVKDLDTNKVTRITREALADLIMHYRDAHDAVCPHPDAFRGNWKEEKDANGGSPWRT